MSEGEPRQIHGGWEEDLEEQFPQMFGPQLSELTTTWEFDPASGRWTEVWKPDVL